MASVLDEWSYDEITGMVTDDRGIYVANFSQRRDGAAFMAMRRACAALDRLITAMEESAAHLKPHLSSARKELEQVR